MKKTIFLSLLCFGWIGLQAQNKSKPMDTVSYSLGVLLGQNLKMQGLESVDLNVMKDAMADVFKGGVLKVTPEEANKNLEAHMKAAQAKKFEKNIGEGKAFLEANAKRPGVKVTASGLQYEVIKEGDGPMPTASDEVLTHYHGTLINGDVFDSSVERGEPISFGVGGVIKGWTEALQLMKKGSKWKLFIPSELAYGANGAGPKIGPHTTLIFEVELLKINGN